MMKHLFAAARILGMAIGLLVAVAGFSQQQKHTPEERAKMNADRMKTAVNLSDSQYEQVYALNLKYAEKMQDLRKQSGDREEKKELVRKMRQEQQQEMRTILTKDQLEAYRNYQKEKRSEMKERRRKSLAQ
jgi:hypothetical protein